MELVVDANVLFSALIKKGLTRELMLNEDLVLYTPEFIIEEFLAHLDEITEKTHVPADTLRQKTMELLIQSDITVLPSREIEVHANKARTISPDPDDAIYFAAALKLSCPIWSNDKALQHQNTIKVYATHDLVELL